MSNNDRVTIGLPTELHEVLKKAAKQNSTSIEAELIHCLQLGLAAREQMSSKRPRGRPPKQRMLKIHDMVLDLAVWWEVSKRPKGKISETISRLKKNEPFKSAGDLRSRYKRFVKRHCEPFKSAGDEARPKQLMLLDGPGTLLVEWNDALWVILAIKRLKRLAPLNAARLNSLIDSVKSFEARWTALTAAYRELEAVTDPNMHSARLAAIEAENDALRKELGI